MWHDVGGGTYSGPDFKSWMTPLANFNFSDLGGQQSYLWGVKWCPWGCSMTVQRVWWKWIICRETTIDCAWSLGISEKFHIYIFEYITFGQFSSFMFPFFPLTVLSYYQPPVCVALLYKRQGRYPISNQSASWRSNYFPISPCFAALLSYIISSFIEKVWRFSSSQRHMMQLRGQCSWMVSE